MRSLSLLGLILLLLGSPAKAQTWISGSLWSYHFDREGDKNERNLGVGVEHVLNERTRIAAGIYHNSNRIDSGYLVGVRCLYKDSHWCGGVLAGGVTGYERYTIIMGGLVASYEGQTWGTNLLLFPKDGGVLALQIKRRFW